MEFMLEKLLNQLRLEYNLTAHPLKGVIGGYTLVINHTTLSLYDLSPGIYLSSPIKKLPKENRENLLILLMEGNFYGQATCLGVIGLDAKEKEILLTKTIQKEITVQDFFELIEEHLNISEYWAEAIQDSKISIY